MEMFFVYILRSENSGRNYTGHTADLIQRVGQHNDKITKSTKNRGPWKLVHQEEFPTRREAIQRERFLKSGQGREEVRRIFGHTSSSSG